MTEQNSVSPQIESRVDISVAEMYTGPVPNPAMLREFDDVVPGSAKSLLDESIAMMAHARSVDEKRVRLVVWTQMWSQIVRWAIVLILVALGAYLLLNDHAIAGYILIAAGVGPNAIAAVVPLVRRRSNEKSSSNQ